MNEKPKILLLVEDDDRLADSLTKILVPLHITVVRVSSWEAGLNTYRSMPKINIVLSDYDLQDSEERTGSDLLEMVSPHIVRILYSGIDREAPEGVLFFNKGEITHLIEYLDNLTMG